MVDIQSARAEIRRGKKKKERKKKETTGRKYNVRICYIECGPMPNVMAALGI